MRRCKVIGLILVMIVLYYNPACALLYFTQFCLIFLTSLLQLILERKINECMFDEHLSSQRSSEEEKECEEFKETVNAQTEKNAEEIFEYSGYAGLFESQEKPHHLYETRTTEHTHEAVNIMENYTPNTSPATGQIKSSEALLKSQQVDDFKAVKEDLQQLSEFAKDSAKQVIADTISPGTFQSHDDSMNDIL